eukprot:2871923-Amphidinium_carterae.1
MTPAGQIRACPEQASKQASKPASKQASKQASMAQSSHPKQAIYSSNKNCYILKYTRHPKKCHTFLAEVVGAVVTVLWSNS